MSEREFQRAVLRLAGLFGWTPYHTHDSRRSNPGFPDLVLVHPRRGVVYAELKSEKGRPTEDQERWLALLREAGQRAYLWRPSSMDEVAKVLQGDNT